MEYPVGFPESLQQPVEVARDIAEIALGEALSNDKAHRLNEACRFIDQVFRAFSRQAGEAERQGLWTGKQSRDGVDSFLKSELIPHAYDLARVSTFSAATFYEPLRLDQFRERVMENSNIWLDYLREKSTLKQTALTGESPSQPAVASGAASGLLTVKASGIVATWTEETDLETPIGRKAAVEAFIARCNQEPNLKRKIRKKDVALALKHQSSRTLQYWQAMNPVAGATTDSDVRRILTMHPPEFLELLRRMGHLR
jgi:hypothetical protein